MDPSKPESLKKKQVDKHQVMTHTHMHEHIHSKPVWEEINENKALLKCAINNSKKQVSRSLLL